jgi:hypothetical protein
LLDSISATLDNPGLNAGYDVVAKGDVVCNDDRFGGSVIWSPRLAEYLVIKKDGFLIPAYRLSAFYGVGYNVICQNRAFKAIKI